MPLKVLSLDLTCPCYFGYVLIKAVNHTTPKGCFMMLTTMSQKTELCYQISNLI